MPGRGTRCQLRSTSPFGSQYRRARLWAFPSSRHRYTEYMQLSSGHPAIVPLQIVTCPPLAEVLAGRVRGVSRLPLGLVDGILLLPCSSPCFSPADHAACQGPADNECRHASPSVLYHRAFGPLGLRPSSYMRPSPSLFSSSLVFVSCWCHLRVLF